MMVRAEEHQVVQVGGAAVVPGHDVVAVTVPRRPIAAGERAATVTQVEGPALAG